ncbi:hypothetical protein SKAU_G00029330 [Synaphobranchus kaupii]|uniref:Uncharacterized protein n=1 Tax=Synaphobranchus kaupii TaxID=118154 RepID=A0A9Q1JEV3_SYNKA|nr:hypothetical protein SKAU_G00029330 [Synaphobranchus kaupii]
MLIVLEEKQNCGRDTPLLHRAWSGLVTWGGLVETASGLARPSSGPAAHQLPPSPAPRLLACRCQNNLHRGAS